MFGWEPPLIERIESEARRRAGIGMTPPAGLRPGSTFGVSLPFEQSDETARDGAAASHRTVNTLLSTPEGGEPLSLDAAFEAIYRALNSDTRANADLIVSAQHFREEIEERLEGQKESRIAELEKQAAEIYPRCRAARDRSEQLRRQFELARMIWNGTAEPDAAARAALRAYEQTEPDDETYATDSEKEHWTDGLNAKRLAAAESAKKRADAEREVGRLEAEKQAAELEFRELHAEHGRIKARIAAGAPPEPLRRRTPNVKPRWDNSENHTARVVQRRSQREA